jgi:hypothetical protein
MTSEDLPLVNSPQDAFLAVLARRQDQTNTLLAAQNELLAQIRDRLPAPVSTAVQEPGVVELREPASVQAAAATEEPKPARKTTTRRRRTAKEG